MARFLVALVLLLVPQAAAFDLDIPKLEKRVTDLAGLLSEEQARNLEQKLQNLESTDSTQIALLIIPSLEGEVLEDYSHRVASAWRLGQKGRDNGALLLLAMKERKVRIEVGYGLEGKLTDALSRRIIQQEIVPHFREGNYPAGIDAAVDAMIKVVRGEYEALPIQEARKRRGSSGWIGSLVWFALPFIFVLQFFGKWLGGIAGGFVGYHLLNLFGVPWWGALLLGGGGGMIVGFILGSMIPRPKNQEHWHAGRRSHSPWIFPGGGGFGGGGGSFGGGGGGFSGGGGSFGGGGSSGSW